MYFEDHVMETSDGCRIWPGAKLNGYPRLNEGRDRRMVHILTCERWYGLRPQGTQVAHSCGNKGCWAGEHLRWATPQENCADRDAHGTTAMGEAHGMSTLTADQVTELRQRYEGGGRARRGENTMTALAKEYGVTIATVSNIINRNTWRHVD